MAESLAQLLQLYTRPAAAMSAILDRGSLLTATIAVLLISVPLTHSNSVLHLPFYAPMLALAVAYIPGLLILCALLGRIGGFLASFRRDYSQLLTCGAMALSAALIPVTIARFLLPLPAFLGVTGAAALFFGVLMFFAVRTVFGAGNGIGAAAVALSWIPLVGAALLIEPAMFLMGWLASPFFLFYAWYFLSGEFSNLGAGMRNRQHFRRMLDAAAINPHDAEAQYQLGLIYQHRRNYTQALQHFQAAVKIDPTEADAHFQLGRIAREQGRTADALASFETVLKLDPKHSLNEILRETGAACLEAGRKEDALQYLDAYVERRPYDPEGLYEYGLALETLGRKDEAREAYARAVESARTAPRFRRPYTARWSRLAQKQQRKLAGR